MFHKWERVRTTGTVRKLPAILVKLALAIGSGCDHIWPQGGAVHIVFSSLSQILDRLCLTALPTESSPPVFISLFICVDEEG